MKPTVLPSREGVRPRTQRTLPHRQLDQWPPAEIYDRLVRKSLELRNVHTRESRLATMNTRALWLPDEEAFGPAEAFIDDHEFCLIHELPEGSVHLTLPDGLREEAVQAGWAERHPSAEAGFLPRTVVLVFAPRDENEMGVVLSLVKASHDFAEGAGDSKAQAI